MLPFQPAASGAILAFAPAHQSSAQVFQLSTPTALFAFRRISGGFFIVLAFASNLVANRRNTGISLNSGTFPALSYCHMLHAITG